MAQKQQKVGGEKPEKASGAVELPVKRPTQPSVRPQVSRPLWPMPAWEREMERLFDDFRGIFRWPRLWGPDRWPSAEIDLQVPAVDVYEKDDEVVVKAEIPGLSKEDIEVTLTDSMLTVKGEKKKEEEVKRQDYYRCERSFGAFSRTVEIPAAVKSEQATATFKDGVLEVRLPKTEEAKRKAVKVEVK